MKVLTRERLAARSAAALFIGAGAVTIANSFAAEELGVVGVDVRVVQICGLVALVSGVLMLRLAPRRLTTTARLLIATWGLLVLSASAALGNYAVTPQAPIVVPVFMMVILVWLGLTSDRGVAAAFAPVVFAAAAVLALAVPGSRVALGDAAVVIVISTVVAETIAWAMCELRSREALLAQQALTDPLTGLFNRAAFAERLEQSCAAGEHLMLAFVDLNCFKDVNDTFGHQVGDAVLVELAQRLQRVARSCDIVARFGGDEFVLLIRMGDDRIDETAILERIRSVIAEPWPMISPWLLTASVGVVDDRDGSMSPAELLGRADTAMYSRKHGTIAESSPATMTSRSLVHHRAAMDGLGGGFTVLQMVGEHEVQDWLVIEANARVRQVYTPVCGDPVGKLQSELDRAADNSHFQALYVAALAEHCRQEAELELRFPGDVTAWRRVVVVPVDDRMVAALTWDITSEKQALQALRDSEERNAAIVESAADAIITVDECGLVRSFNRTAEEMFEVTRDEAIGRPYTPFVPEPSLAELRAAFGPGRAVERLEVPLRRTSGDEFHAQVAISEVETSVGTVLTAIVRDVTAQRLAEAALRTALERDELTGLPNLRSLLERTELAAATARQRGDDGVGLLLVDLDRFTLVNDSLGHDLGDELLVQVADRIRHAVRERDTVTRLSGDQFVVLCERADSEQVLTGLAVRIQRSLREPFRLGQGREVFATASIGAVLGRGSEVARDLLRFADTAMHRAKRTGPSGVQVFSEDMSASSASRLEAETGLRHAVERDELRAFYQPIVDLHSGALQHLEALIRWERPGRGIVEPDEFVPMAEETGLIEEVGTWILRRAVADCAAWQAQAPGVAVSINVSAHQFRTGDLVRAVGDALDEAGLAPELVMLEITESVMLEHSDWNLAVLERVCELGVSLALDDFGTGYSALTHLRRLPIDTIKIDRSFLEMLETQSDLPTIRAIVELALAHGIDVVAEGIETEATRALVLAAGCTRGQGYLFARPAPFEQVIASAPATAPSTAPATV